MIRELSVDQDDNGCRPTGRGCKVPSYPDPGTSRGSEAIPQGDQGPAQVRFVSSAVHFQALARNVGRYDWSGLFDVPEIKYDDTIFVNR